MAKSEKQKIKILYIAKVLMEETDENHPISTKELIAYLGEQGISVERKAIYRDIEELREMGMEINMNPSRNGGGFYLVSRVFETADLKILIDLVQASKFLSNNKTRELISKIETLTSNHIAGELEHEVFYADRIKTESKSVLFSVDTLHNAISQDNAITFNYIKRKSLKEMQPSPEQHHVVSPYYLVSNNDNYYMVGFNERKEAIRTYRVDRMKDVKILDRERKGKDQFVGFSIENYTNKAFGMFAGEAIKVNLQFHEDILDVILDRFGKRAAYIPVPGQNAFETTVDVVPSGQFYGWLAGIGKQIKLVGPTNIVEEYKTYLKTLLSMY